VFGCIHCFLAGWAVDRYGPKGTALSIGLFTGLSLLLTSQTSALWQLFITYSLLFSVVGAVYTTIMSTVSRWFDKNRGLALGLAGSGVGMGSIVIAPFAAYLIAHYGWRMAYIIMGVIAWVIIIPLSGILKKSPYDFGAEPGGAESASGEGGTALPGSEGNSHATALTLRGASGTRSFWFFGCAWFLNAFCYFMVMIHLVPYATDMGISAMDAATALSLAGAGLIAGRLLTGRFSDSIGSKKTAVTCALLVVISMIWLIRSRDLFSLYVFGVVFGFFNGGLDTAMAALVGDIFGIQNIGVIMGTLQINWGIGVIVGPAVGGIVFDAGNSYFAAFLAGALAMLAASIFVALTRRERL